MTLLKNPFAPLRTRRPHGLTQLDNHLRRDSGLAEMPAPLGLDLTILFFSRNRQ